MPKNIVVFSDGTSEKGGLNSRTNVYKLFNMIEDRTEKQISFYDPGIGTNWQLVSGSIGGAGISKNIKECYRFIFENYQAGDKIYLFGFSRGAGTVRSLSGFLHLFGILPASRPDLINKAYRIYKIRNRKKREQKAKEFVESHHTMWCTVHFLGVWDTVTALGLPNPVADKVFNLFVPHKFHDFTLSDSVKVARHALAIDEARGEFSPKLWVSIDDKERMKQVWFVGDHSDVGGGHKVEKDGNDISIFPFRWMVREALSYGLRLSNTKAYSALWEIDEDDVINGTIHTMMKGFMSLIYHHEIRSLHIENKGKPMVHESVLKRKLNHDNRPESSGYFPWILKMLHEDLLEVEHDAKQDQYSTEHKSKS